jgi:transglutaminase-like putative cysteine protease
MFAAGPTSSGIRTFGASTLAALFVWMTSASTLAARQVASESLPADSFASSTRSTWEFGVRITAQSDARKINVSFPLPINWPEQSVFIENIDSSPQIRRYEEKDLKTAKLMMLHIDGLAIGEQAHLIVRVVVDKQNLVPPDDVGQFVFAKKPSASLKPYLSASPQIESNDKVIRTLSDELPIDSQATPWEQVKTLFDWVRDNIQYRFEETNRSCLEALASKEGDCGEMTGLFIALCRARGIPARAVWIPHHTYPEFYLEDPQGVGHWFPCQVAGPYEFGGMTEPSPILQKGDNFRIPGLPRARRYVQPTLSADGGPLQLEFIMQRVDKVEGERAVGERAAPMRVETNK